MKTSGPAAPGRSARTILGASLLGGVLLLASAARGDDPKPLQANRRDLALHLERLETAIRSKHDAFEAQKAQVASLVTRATMAFFAQNGALALDALGEARAAILGRPWDVEAAARNRVRLVVPPVVVRAAEGPTTVEVRLEALGAPPSGGVPLVRWAAWSGGDPRTISAAMPFAAWAALPLRTWTVPLDAKGRIDLDVVLDTPANVAAGVEHRVRGACCVVDASVPGRFAAVQKALEGVHDVPTGTPAGVRPTLERLSTRIALALRGEVGDVIPDVAEELRRLELGVEGLAAAAAARRPYHPQRTALEGDTHRATGHGRPYRLYVPVPGSKKPSTPPLIVALHGAGGNEDMYFEAYGGGEAVRQAEQRGWILASPESAKDAVEVVEDLQTLLAIDMRRVYLTGHSMGAGAAWSAAVARPDLWTALAPVAGGWMATSAPSWAGLTKMPVLAVTGEKDFSRAMAERTAAQAKAAGVPVEQRTVPGLDHLLVVGETLPEVFAFFERLAKP